MTVRLDVDGALGTLTLDRAEAGNRLDTATLGQLRDHLATLPGRGVDVLLLQANGDDFCLGRQGRTGAGPPQPDELDDLVALVGGTNRLLQRFPGVTIAAVQGRAVGAGLSLAGRCDLVVAGEGARLSFPEIRHDIAPTFVMSHYRFVLPRRVLNDMVMTGRELTAEEGVAAGLVSRVIPDGEVHAAARALAGELLAYDAAALRTIKQYLLATDDMTPDAAVEHGNAVMRADFLSRAQR